MNESLLLLVGSNPLPNYLAAMALKPARIHLVHSGATRMPKERLFQALRDDLKPAPRIDADAFVSDAFSSSDVYRTVADLMEVGGGPQFAHLHYTGGTKVMSAHALKAFYDNGGTPENASYLDESNVCLRFDGNRESRALADFGVTLSLERIQQLHSIKHKIRSHVERGPTSADVNAIAQAVTKRPQLASCLYGESQRLKDCKNPNAAKDVPFTAADYALEISAASIPFDNMSRREFEAWHDFLGGEWLEDWIAEKVEQIGLAGSTEIKAGVNCHRADSFRPFEVDVAVIRGLRSYFISCTTDMTSNICKSKAFEISVRSRQMGGDLARAALVGLLPNEAVGNLQADIDEAWQRTNPTKVFGLEDVRTWAGQYGPPNLDNLKEWLES